MGRTSDKDRVKRWLGRCVSAEKAKKAWANRFDVEFLEQLYIGEHNDTDDKYVINLCFPSVETRLSMMTVDKPFFRVEPKPQRADDQGTNIEARAKLREDTLNCKIADERVGFMDTAALCTKEAHWAFGVAEIVYGNDFIDNPNAGRPLLNDDNSEKRDDAGNVIVQPAKIPNPDNEGAHEYIYVKRIPSKQFVVSLNPRNKLSENDWCGYWAWHLVSDVKANPNYSNTSGLKATGQYKQEYVDPTAPEESESKAGMVKLWKIWDIRASKTLVFAEGHEKFLLEEPYDIFNLAALKFHEMTDEFYPLPPMYNWRAPQKALNETRDAQMAYLGQAYEKFLYKEAQITDVEMRKLEERRNGVYAKVEGAGPISDAIIPVPKSGMDASFWRNLPASKEDFVFVSAVSSEQKGVADSETATQAGIIDMNARRRETKDATKVARWMAEIGRIMLETMRKRMALPIWVKTNVDPLGQNAQAEAANVIATWREITSEALGDESYEVTVDVESLSPMSDQERQAKFGSLMRLLGPGAIPALQQSRLLVKEVFGFKSDRDIREVQNALGIAIQTMQKMAQAKQGDQAKPEASDPEKLLQMMIGGMQGAPQ